MQIQVHTDDKVQGGESLNAWVETEIKDKLARFSEHITRIEAHLSDASGTRVVLPAPGGASRTAFVCRASA